MYVKILLNKYVGINHLCISPHLRGKSKMPRIGHTVLSLNDYTIQKVEIPV